MYLAKTDSWHLERVIWLVAGMFILISVALTLLVSKYWILFTAFIGLNLLIFGLTGFCLMANILKKFGFESRIQ